MRELDERRWAHGIVRASARGHEERGREDPGGDRARERGVVSRVAWARRAQRADRRSAVEVRVADEIEELVPRGLVRQDLAAPVEDVVSDDEDALAVDVAREAGALELEDVALEPERARGRDLSRERGRVAVPRGARRAAPREIHDDLDTHRVTRDEFVDGPVDVEPRASADAALGRAPWKAE